jgi:hypothetical protein
MRLHIHFLAEIDETIISLGRAWAVSRSILYVDIPGDECTIRMS